jgi:hypothetical protein
MRPGAEAELDPDLGDPLAAHPLHDQLDVTQADAVADQRLAAEGADDVREGGRRSLATVRS